MKDKKPRPFYRKILRILLTFIVLIFGIYILIYFYVNEYARDIVYKIINKDNPEEYYIADISLSFPFRITIHGIEYKNIHIDKLIFDLQTINLINRQINIKQAWIINADIEIKNEINLEHKFENATNNENSKTNSKKWQVNIKKLFLKKSNITYKNTKVTPLLTFAISQLQGKIDNLIIPFNGKLKFNLLGLFTVNNFSPPAGFNIYGWIDLLGKNMDVILQAKEIDYFMLKDYYPPFWKPDNLHLSKAFFSLDIHALSKNDNLLLDYYILLPKVEFDHTVADEEKIKNLQNILALFAKTDIPMAHFSYQTKMSNPKFEVSSIGETLLTQLKSIKAENTPDRLKNLIDTTQSAVHSGVKGIKSITIDPTVNAVKGFTDTLFNTFKKIFGQ